MLLLLATGCSAQGGSQAGAASGTADPQEASEAAKGSEAAAGAEASQLHPSFDMTRTQLSAMLEEQPESIRRAVLERPQYFLELMGKALELPSYALVLVDKQHGLSSDYQPGNIVSLNGFSDTLVLNKDSLSLREEVIPHLIAMSEAARLDGVTLDISSSYRSYQYQENLFSYYVNELGREQAEQESAQPGHSQHQLGTTVDFGSVTPAFAETDAAAWLREHAGEYGFSLSYPEGMTELTGYMYESWHYRFITRVGTEIQQEFFDDVQQHFLEFFHRHRDELEAARQL
jgi:D-alanyl-D-alanine carboxypeptidase